MHFWETTLFTNGLVFKLNDIDVVARCIFLETGLMSLDGDPWIDRLLISQELSGGEL